MAIADTIQSMYDNVEDVYDTITNVTLPSHKNIENIPSTIRKSYLDIMNNGIDTIYDNWEKVNGTGTSISLNNTEEAPMKIEYKGNTSQNSTTGANILPQNKYISTQTTNGITYTNNGDGTFNLVGTASANTTIQIIPIGNIELMANQPYYLYSSVPYNGTTFNMSIAMTNNGTKFILANGTYTPTTTPTNERLQFYIASGQSINQTNIKMMLVKGSTAPSQYESYTGGIPAPNPYFPEDIHVVSGDNSINVCGKNLFDKDNTNVINAYIDASGVLTGSPGNRTIYIPCQPNTTYTVSRIKPQSGNNKFGICCTDILPAVGVQSNLFLRNYTANSLTMTTNSTAKYLCVWCWVTDFVVTLDEMLATIQIEKGTATTYEPYKSASYPISLGDIELCKLGDYQDRIAKSTGKNLWYDIPDRYSHQGITLTKADDGGYVLNGTTTGVTIFNFNLPVPIEQGTYVLSIKASANIPNNVFLRARDSNMTMVTPQSQVQGNNTTSNSNSFTCTTDIYTLSLNLTTSGVTYNNLKIYPMIEKGSTATDYEPYGKVWYLNKQIGKVVLNENTTLTSYTTNVSGHYRYGVNISNIKKTSSATELPNIYCSHYVGQVVGTSGSWGGHQGISIDNTNARIYINDDTYYTQDTTAYKTWLSANNVSAYYPLETPTYTEITDTTLLSQLEAIKKSYDNQTNISQENNDLPFVLNAIALKNMN